MERLKLPDFLYKEGGLTEIGYEVGSVVTEEWNDYIKELLSRFRDYYNQSNVDGLIIEEENVDDFIQTEIE